MECLGYFTPVAHHESRGVLVAVAIMDASKRIGKSKVAAFGSLVLSTDDVPEFTFAAIGERPLVVKSEKKIVE